MTPPSDEDSRGRILSAFDIGCIVVGGIIGVGIFFTPAEVARRVDDSTQVLAAWGIGGLIALAGALVFAELSCRLPGHGGTFVYIRTAFGDLTAFLFGWANCLVIQSGAAGVIGLVLADNLDVLLFGGGTLSAWTRVGIAALAIAGFVTLNLLGLRVGRGVQNTLTVTKTLAVFGLVALAAWVGAGEIGATTAVAETTPRGWPGAMSAAILPVLFAFGGWQHGSFVAGAARRPLRDVPLGIVGGVVVVVVAYIAVNLAFLDLLGMDGARASEAIAADAARVALQPFGHGELAARVLAALVVLSSLGILNTISLAPPYVLVVMAREHFVPAAIGSLHRGTGAPLRAIALQGGWSITLLLVVALFQGGDAIGTLGFLLDGVVFVDWIFYGLCGLALIVLRRKNPAVDETSGALGFRAPGGGIVAGLFLLFAVGVAAGAVITTPEPSLAGLAACALGGAVYLATRRRRAEARAAPEGGEDHES